MSDRQKQILLLSPFFYPEPISTGKANKHLAEAFVADGSAVTVVCSHPVYPTWVPERSAAQLQGMTILRGGGWLRYPKSMPLRRLILEFWFALHACRKVWRRRNQADVAVSVLPPSLFAFLVHLLLPQRVRRVAVIHDLQGVLAAQKQSAIRRAIVHAIHSVERRALRSQHLCIFFSEDMARIAQSSYGLHPGQVAVQYPFVTLPPQGKFAGSELAGILSPDTMHVVYSGALGYKQNSERLVAFLHAAARRYPELHFHVFSGGPFFERLRTQYESIPTPRVYFHPLVDERDLVELYARSAIQIIPQAENTEAAALPSKLPNLLAAGVYLMGICPEQSEVARLIREAGTGTVVERWDEQLFLQRLGEALDVVMYESSAQRRARVGPLMTKFSVENIVALAMDRPVPAHIEAR